MKVLIYDSEIANAIPETNQQIRPNIHYCRGWKDFQGMGVACVTVYDYLMDQYRVFFEDNLNDFAALIEESELVVGFNNEQFDDNLMAVSGVVIDPEKVYDILQEIWAAAGHGYVRKPDDFIGRIHGGYNLDNIAEVNLRVKKMKLPDDTPAPILWQQNRRGKVVDYGLTDTWLTKRLFDKIWSGEQVLDPKSGMRLTLVDPRTRLKKADPAA